MQCLSNVYHTTMWTSFLYMLDVEVKCAITQFFELRKRAKNLIWCLCHSLWSIELEQLITKQVRMMYVIPYLFSTNGISCSSWKIFWTVFMQHFVKVEVMFYENSVNINSETYTSSYVDEWCHLIELWHCPQN